MLYILYRKKVSLKKVLEWLEEGKRVERYEVIASTVVIFVQSFEKIGSFRM
jgi:hypothetical protein